MLDIYHRVYVFSKTYVIAVANLRRWHVNHVLDPTMLDGIFALFGDVPLASAAVPLTHFYLCAVVGHDKAVSDQFLVVGIESWFGDAQDVVIVEVPG